MDEDLNASDRGALVAEVKKHCIRRAGDYLRLRHQHPAKICMMLRYAGTVD
ncbi:MAG TPA: hypothetical protein VHO25_10630 [Polyangiaceae bacterium]|nr:hypothetical protein [Polyangiaceae bacterium]